MSHALPPRGRRWQSSLLWVMLAGCAGGAVTTTYSGTSPAPAPDAFACARQQLKNVGFTQTSYDVDALRVTARKYNETQRRPDVQFRRIVDRLEIEIGPGSGDVVTAMTIQAKTFAELITHRGPTEEQEKTSDIARTAAETIVKQCAQPVDSLSVPG